MRLVVPMPRYGVADAVHTRTSPIKPAYGLCSKWPTHSAGSSRYIRRQSYSVILRAVQEPIALPAFNPEVQADQLNTAEVDFDEELVAQHKGLKFKLHFASRPGQQVVVTGSSKSLGSWDLQQALPLTWQEGHVWTNTEAVEVAPDEDIEYKYVVTSEQQPRVLWCQGQNLALKVPSTGQTWTLQDSWSPSTNQVLQEGLADDACLASNCLHDPANGGGSFPVAIPFKCFLCGHCSQPELHVSMQHHGVEDCPLHLSSQDAEERFLKFIKPSDEFDIAPDVSMMDTDA